MNWSWKAYEVTLVQQYVTIWRFDLRELGLTFSSKKGTYRSKSFRTDLMIDELEERFHEVLLFRQPI